MGPPQIEPFRHAVSADPNYADRTWKVLENAIHEIHNKNASGLSFEELYRNAYNMVLHKFGDKLYTGLIRTLTMQLKQVAAEVEKSQGVSFLKELKTKWDEHIKSTQMIRDILMYMDRTYVTQQSRVPVYPLGLELWRDNVLRNKEIAARLLRVLTDLVSKERSGEQIERGLIKSITLMLTDLGPQVYQEDFERNFLSGAADFYKKEAQDFLAGSDCPSYLRKAEKRLLEEQERVQAYLAPDTEPKITRVVETELILNQVRACMRACGGRVGRPCMCMAHRSRLLARSCFTGKQGASGLGPAQAVLAQPDAFGAVALICEHGWMPA